MPASVDYSDVQGLVRFGFKKLTEASYALLTIKNTAAAREWLRNAPVTTAVETTPPPRTALQIAFTREGLEKLQVPDNVIARFSPEFVSGMAGEENRSRRLGDTQANSHLSWRWGGRGAVPHALACLFAEPGLFEGWKRSVKSGSWNMAFEEVIWLPTSHLDGIEPFGFVDGISQPELDWEQTRKVPVNCDQIEYGNLVSLGEFLLGHSNEYGKYTDRPLLDPQASGSEELCPAADQPGKRDLGLNGTYLVMRQLEQDVRGFWQYLDRVSDSNRDARYRLAEAFVGRSYSNGAPLVPLSKTQIAGVGGRGDKTRRRLDIELNQFT
jgi:hypothetical protein